MKFLDSFSHYDLTGFLLKWDSISKSSDAEVSFVAISDSNSGGAGMQFSGAEVEISKLDIEAMSPSVLAFRTDLDGKMTVSFLYGTTTLGYCVIDGGAGFIYDADGTVSYINITAGTMGSHFWEFKIDPNTAGSFQVYLDETLLKSVSGDFQNIGNYVNGFRIKFESAIETQLSDLFIGESQLGIKAVKGFFPSSDVDVDMIPSSAVDHYTLLNDDPQDTDSYVTSAEGQVEVLGYVIDTSDMFSVSAVALSPLVGKDVGADESGIGVKGIMRSGTDFNFGTIYPTSEIRTLQLIAEMNPSTSGSWTPEGIASLSIGVEVSLDS